MRNKTYSFRIYWYRDPNRGSGDAGTHDFLKGLTLDQLDTEKFERLQHTHANPERFLKPSKEILAGVEGYDPVSHGVEIMTKPAGSYSPKGAHAPRLAGHAREDAVYAEGNTMKITKRQLRRIIKEEKQKLIEGSVDDVAKEMAKVIDQIGSHRFARAAMDALGDEATEKGQSIVNWVKRQYGLKDSPPLPKPKRKATRRVGTSRDGLTPR